MSQSDETKTLLKDLEKGFLYTAIITLSIIGGLASWVALARAMPS